MMLAMLMYGYCCGIYSRRKAIVEPDFGQAKRHDASDASRCVG
jgi:hypothetical protein